MNLLTLLTFAVAMFLLAVSPGPGVFATLARALASGFSHAAVLVLGVVIGDLIFLLLAIYGLSSMAEMLGSFFIFIKYAGGTYLLWLGFKIWRTPPELATVQGVREFSWKKNFISGLSITLANPKVILFYLGFLPTFVELSSLTHLDVLAISGVVTIILGSVLLSYAWAAALARCLFTSRKTVSTMNKCAGGVMMTAGAVLLTKN